MILDLTNKLIKPVTIIALISIVITWAFNIQNILVETQTINGITIKVVNLRTYLSALSNAWETNALNFDDILPTRQFESTNNFISDISNNMLALFDWLYFPINFLLYIIRWTCWIFKLLLTIIGWNTGVDSYGNYYSELARILTWVTQNLMIPYV